MAAWASNRLRRLARQVDLAAGQTKAVTFDISFRHYGEAVWRWRARAAARARSADLVVPPEPAYGPDGERAFAGISAQESALGGRFLDWLGSRNDATIIGERTAHADRVPTIAFTFAPSRITPFVRCPS